MGLYQANIKQLATNYIYPQENGNRHQTGRMAIYNRFMQGLLFSNNYDQTHNFDFNVSNYSTAMLEKAKHIHELSESPNVICHLDYKQCGLGSATCGPDPAMEFRITPQNFCMKFKVKAFSPSQLNQKSFFS